MSGREHRKWLILLVAEPPAGLGALTGIRDTQSGEENTERKICSQISVSKPSPGGGAGLTAAGKHKMCSAGQ